MKRVILLVLVLFAAIQVSAQENDVTTFILVRHAEKVLDGSWDPTLTKTGFERARDLAYVLENIDLDAVYCTQYKRTRLTVEPAAGMHNLEIGVVESLDLAGLREFVDIAAEKHSGGTILFASHSNIVPQMIKVIRQEQFDPKDVPYIHDKVYDDIFVVSFKDRNNVTVLNIKYGSRTDYR